MATVSVGTTAAVLISSVGDTLIRNNGPEAAFLGDSSVTADQTSTGGVQLNAGEVLSFTGRGLFDLWAVTASGTALVSYVEV